MADNELYHRVRELRRLGRSPKQIARCLGVPLARVAPAVRAAASEGERARSGDGATCWVNRGWAKGLGTEQAAERWPEAVAEGAQAGAGQTGLANVLAARRRRAGRAIVCGYLVDTWCLGVKDTLGPQSLDEGELAPFVDEYYACFDTGFTKVPLDLARHIVWGAVEYARGLGFRPHPDLGAAASHLGPLEEACAIEFGCDGSPSYVQGPFDDARRVVETLERSAGAGNFHFLARLDSLADEPGFEHEGLFVQA